MEQVDVDWRQLESSLDDSERLMSSLQTTVLPCWQATCELSACMDQVEETVKELDSKRLQLQTADDVTQLHDKFKVPVLAICYGVLGGVDHPKIGWAPQGVGDGAIGNSVSEFL